MTKNKNLKKPLEVSALTKRHSEGISPKNPLHFLKRFFAKYNFTIAGNYVKPAQNDCNFLVPQCFSNLLSSCPLSLPSPSSCFARIKRIRATRLHPLLACAWGEGFNNVTDLSSYRLIDFPTLKKKAAFTLAEVLITLGIIGVVAAMTIPALMTAYKKHVVETRLARTYSIVSQAIKLAEENYGEGFGVDELKADSNIKALGDGNGYSWELSHAAFEQFFKPGIKTIHTYTKDQMESITVYFGSNPANEHYFAWYDLLDGTRLGFQMSGNYEGIKFIIIPKPNKTKLIGGVDTFFIEFRPVNGAYEYYPFWYDAWKDGTITRKNLVEWCGSDQQYPAYASSADSFCFQLLKISGYKIPADYPLKF